MSSYLLQVYDMMHMCLATALTMAGEARAGVRPLLCLRAPCRESLRQGLMRDLAREDGFGLWLDHHLGLLGPSTISFQQRVLFRESMVAHRGERLGGARTHFGLRGPLVPSPSFR